MKCPKCGSERIQFGTNTSGGGYSVSDACCGTIVLGPLGLLCGACGSGTKTEEFWICQDCGNKFSNKEGQQNQKREEAAKENYIKCKQIRDEAIKQCGTVAEVNKAAVQSLRKKDEISKKYNEARERFVAESGDEKFKKKALKSEGSSERFYNWLIIFLIAGIVLLVLGLAPVGFVLLGIALFMFLKELWNMIIYKDFVDTKFTEASADNQKLYEEMKAAEEEYEQWQKSKKAISICEAYEQKENQQ